MSRRRGVENFTLSLDAPSLPRGTDLSKLPSRAEIRDVLARARVRLDGGSAWCRGAVAKNPDGAPVDAGGVEACAWDVLGAIIAETGPEAGWSDRVYFATNEVAARLVASPFDGRAAVTAWNDDRRTTWNDVDAVLGLATEALA